MGHEVPMTLVEARHATDADLAAFQARVDAVVHAHPVVTNNSYTRWFASGAASREGVGQDL